MTGLADLPPRLRNLRPVKTLQRSLEKDQVAHAILLTGSDLFLLEELAEALAASLLKCRQPVSRHPDYFSLRPARKSRSIPIGKRNEDEPNTVRSLIRNLFQTSHQGGYKVAVVYEADRMNAQAANAFLKTLEEPPPQTVIILLTTRLYEVMETIRSRAFQFKLPGSPPEELPAPWQTWLQDYRQWIRGLHLDPAGARQRPDVSIMTAYGLISRLVDWIEHEADRTWHSAEETLPENISDEEREAMQTGFLKGHRDRLLIDIEEATRLAAIELSHHVPFPANQLTQAIASLEASTGLLALNMKDETALEGFFHQSLKIWTSPT
jgi:DNA polymerase-3 subunit delta'